MGDGTSRARWSNAHCTQAQPLQTSVISTSQPQDEFTGLAEMTTQSDATNGKAIHVSFTSPFFGFIEPLIFIFLFSAILTLVRGLSREKLPALQHLAARSFMHSKAQLERRNGRALPLYDRALPQGNQLFLIKIF
jgi:hypothetical protein